MAAEPPPKVDSFSLTSCLERNVDQQRTLLIADDFHEYWGIASLMNYAMIEHTACYVDGILHTNTIDGFW